MSKFSVGDRVVFTSDESCHVGFHGEVKGLPSWGVHVLLDNGYECGTDEDYLTLESEYEALSAPPLSDATKVVKRSDAVNHPSHYTDGWSNGSEVIDITEHMAFNRGNAVKYLARAGKKDPDKELEDLKKAAWYINREIERLENTND
ncbi:DUF3310 domain-containing protein [Streptomyces sp. NBC_01500]|uniref:DUF3310 domain-containing protein n=1 Tax=Streptomyces sp. NBC_01500 TaxID=2903886 RepID=UPI002255C0B2|nr:DUF3310 domain-containing protein [Streptomyces sp. NBC_01500]MCX4554114.1 DUF3310 domain-containing protein [Streptomyces sp. NBC_01500]